MKTTNVKNVKEERLLATQISNNKDFESACLANDFDKIIAIVDMEMENNNLYTNGSIKLKNDISRIILNRSEFTGEQIMFFVWNSRLSGTGFAVQA